MAFGLLVISSLLLAVVLFATVDLGRTHHWNSLETTSVKDLPDSGTVKVVGVINESVSSTVIGIHETTLDVGYSTEYDPDGGRFNFSDGTGTVNISWDNWYRNSRDISLMMFLLISSVLILITFFGFVWLLLGAHIRVHYWIITMMYPLGSLFLMICFSGVFKWSYTKPRKVGVSETGIHFLYADPYVQLSNPGFASWEDIKHIGTRIIESDDAISLEKRLEISLTDVKKKIRHSLISEWEGRTSGKTKRERRFALMKPE